ncbi:MAG TPA: HlyC/CorC family transporter [Candidatus Omnitrophica bacterium]|nr:HlyC/CorC family transporter [Candidatus Omnitrophota bacterium]
MLFNIFFLIAFIILSSFFSASETALFSLSDLKLRRMQDKYPQAKKIKTFLKRPTHLLSVIVFGNMLVNIGISSLATILFVNIFKDEGLVLAIIFSGIIILFLGEIFPKTIAIYSAEKFSLFCYPFLNFFSKIFYLVIFLIEKIVEKISFLFIPKKRKIYTEEELKTALNLGKKNGHITSDQKLMISYVLEFKDTKVREILTPRVDIEAIEISSSQEEVLKILREKRHSKFPVYENSLDNIIGILYAKDVFLNPNRNWRLFLREPLFVPESKRIGELLKTFMEKGERAAICLDEYGGTQGLVTLEDIEEEIFGEIYDEFEDFLELIVKIDENTFRIAGKTPIKTINIELDLDLPEEEDTLAGFLLSQMGKIPRAKEKFEYYSLQAAKFVEFIIERATTKRIISIILKR